MSSLRLFLHKWEIDTKPLTKLTVLSLFISLLNLAQPEVLRWATSAIVDQDSRMLVLVIIFAFVAAFIYMSLNYIKDISTKGAQNNLEQSFGSLLFKRFINVKMIKLGEMQFGDIAATIIRSVEMFAESTVNYVSTVSSAYFSLAITFAYMCFVQWQLALCVLVYNLVIRFFAQFVEHKMKKNSKELTATMKESGNELSALLRNMLVVRIYSNADFFRERVKSRETAVRKAGWKRFVWSNGFSDHIWAFSKLAEFLIVYGVGAVLIYHGISDISILMTFVFANDLFTIGINNLSYSIDAKADAQAHRENLENLLDESDLEDEPLQELKNPRGDIEFQNVSFGYGDRLVLDHVSFVIHPGEHILLQGPNGQGKSTILKLLSGLYRPKSGKILWGGEDIGQINIDALRKVSGYISQHSHILDGNTIENLMLASDPQKEKALSILNMLDLSHCITTDPKHLSMGEQQRLNIGRTLYRDSCYLLLCDEIFSNVDRDNRQNIAELLERMFPAAAAVLISHEDVPYRIDRTLRVENGRVVEVANEKI